MLLLHLYHVSSILMLSGFPHVVMKTISSCCAAGVCKAKLINKKRSRTNDPDWRPSQDGQRCSAKV